MKNICKCCGADLDEVGVWATATMSFSYSDYVDGTYDMNDATINVECANCNSGI